jgi:hypothetical protein
MDAQCGIGNGLEAGLRDLLPAGLALAITSIFNPSNCRFNLVEGVVLTPQQTQREFLIEVAGRKFCHAVGHTRDFAVVLVQGVIFHLGRVVLESCSQSQKSFSVNVGVRHSVESTNGFDSSVFPSIGLGEELGDQAGEPNWVIGGSLSIISPESDTVK